MKELKRLFFVRKDLHMSPGKLAAQVAHGAEIYWINKIEDAYAKETNSKETIKDLVLPAFMEEGYLEEGITKVVLKAESLDDLNTVIERAKGLHLHEGRHFGLINDACRTELEPENENGSTTTCVWFAPMPEDITSKISEGYKLY